MDDELAAVIRSLHDTLEVCLKTVEALASECAEIAALAEQNGDRVMTDALRRFARSHRIKALELNGRLAVMEEKYRTLLQPEA